MAPLKINEKAPFFTAQDQNGQTHRLSDYKGRWVLLYFYPKDYTPGCTTEACTLRDQFSDLKDKMQILGVSPDSVQTHKDFSEKHRLPFLLLSDPNRDMIKAYGANGFFFTKRISFLIDPDQNIAKIYPKVKPSLHAKEVLEDFERLSRNF